MRRQPRAARRRERILAASAHLSEGVLDLERPAIERFASLWDEQADEARFRSAIAELFTVEGEAGRGGMGIVYRARGVRDDGLVALKVLRTTVSAEGATRFRREIALTARLQHPHILRAIDSGETGGRLWYTMPFVAGESLRERLRRGSMDVSEAIELLAQLASALEHAHANGIVHRDLKPEKSCCRRPAPSSPTSASRRRSSHRSTIRERTTASRARRPVSRWERRCTCRPSRQPA